MNTQRKTRIQEAAHDIQQRFLTGRFPVATLDSCDGLDVESVLGLVVARGYNAEETFYGMLLRAETRGAEAIIGYRESVAFHPDGSRFYTCYGTAVRLGGSGGLGRVAPRSADGKHPG
ncbi:hypothetical protein LJC26_01060 [Desulfovibrio sp. OttesenSCG-928-O18]|nr:hypothetical protein [Desulfovibrio sp. OttesenSCG-928-O18]